MNLNQISEITGKTKRAVTTMLQNQEVLNLDLNEQKYNQNKNTIDNRYISSTRIRYRVMINIAEKLNEQDFMYLVGR